MTHLTDTPPPQPSVPLHECLTQLALKLDAAQEGCAQYKTVKAKLAGVIIATAAMRDFMRSIPALDQVASPIDILLAALRDVTEDRTPELFEVTGASGRPVSTHELFLKIHTVGCTALLRASGLSAAKAREYISDLWDKLEIRQVAGENVRLIKPSTIEGWEIWARAEPVGSLAHEQLQLASSEAASHRSLEEAKSYARIIGEKLARWATWQDKAAPKEAGSSS